MQCHEQGKTKMLLRNIPFFKDIVIISFFCEHCQFKNHEFTPLTPLADQGVKLTLKVSKQEDLNRMIIANVNSVIYIPEIDFEVPKIPKGLVSTIQGALNNFAEDLSYLQEQRKEAAPDVHAKVEETINKLELMAQADPSVLPYFVILNDPSGHSFIANPFAPLMDVNLKEEHYERTKEQMIDLGFVSDVEVAQDPKLQAGYQEMKDKGADYLKQLPKTKGYKYTDEDTHALLAKMQGMASTKDAHKLDHSKTVQEQDLDSRLTIIQVDCFGCGAPGELRNFTCEIPFFKEVVIMAFTCDKCGYRNTEVKTIGQMSQFAKRITLTATSKDDLNRDLFKSDSCVLKIKELEFEMSAGSMGSFYTTVEGIFEKIINTLKEQNPFVGDSAESEQMKKWNEFLGKVELMKAGEMLPFTLELDDPLDNCFILNPNYPQPDPNVVVEEYERTAEQKEELGLDHMSV